MFKSLKFLYDLGIRHERIRIAAHLQHRLDMVSNSIDRDMDIMRAIPDNHSKQSKSAHEKIQFKRAVNNHVQAIINEIFNAQGDWIPGASLMFPDDKHKGEL